MPVVLIVNPKGGVGKSTVATNLAGYFASRGNATMLGDLDKQQSALGWLARRPAGAAAIVSWDVDTDRIIVPLQASLFDIYATQTFLERLQERTGLKESGHVGVLGMRVDQRTRAAEQLHRFVDSLGMPVLGFLRDTQNYVQLAAHGLTLWDVAPSRVEKDVVQWQPLIGWVETGVLQPASAETIE